MGKFTKRLLASGMAVVMSLGISATAFAGETPAKPQSKNVVSIQLNGENVSFKTAQPIEKGERTFVPFRDLFETLGATIDYDATTKTIAATLNEKTVSFVLGNADVTVKNGDKTETIKTDAPSFVEKGCTFVPLRFAAQTLGYTVGWDNDANTAIIVDKDALLAELDGNYTIMDKYLAYAKQFTEENYTFKGDMSIDMKATNPATSETLPIKATGNFTGITGEDKMNMDFAINVDVETIKTMILAKAKEEASTSAATEVKKDETTTVEVKKDETTTVEVNKDETTTVEVKKDETATTEVKNDETATVEVKNDETATVEVKNDETATVEVKKDETATTEVKNDETAKDDSTAIAMLDSLKDLKIKYIVDMESGKYYFNAPALSSLAGKDANTWFLLDLNKMMKEMMPEANGFNFKDLLALSKGTSYAELLKGIFATIPFNTKEDYASAKELISMSKKFLSDEAFKKTGDTYTTTYKSTKDGNAFEFSLNFTENNNAINGYSMDLAMSTGTEPIMTFNIAQKNLKSTAKMSLTIPPFVTMNMDMNMTMKKTTEKPIAKPADGKIVDMMNMQ